MNRFERDAVFDHQQLLYCTNHWWRTAKVEFRVLKAFQIDGNNVVKITSFTLPPSIVIQV